MTRRTSEPRSALFARLCLQNGGKLSKRKRERCFADLTDEQVRVGEEAAEKAKQDFDTERAVSIITAEQEETGVPC